MTRVAAYCRVSTDQEDQMGSLVHQRQYFDQYIARQPDWRLVEIFADEGISGTSAQNRPAFRRMVETAYAGEIDLILTKEVSRFARNTVDTLAHTRELRKRGVGIVFINDNIDTRQDDGEFRLTIMASVAQEESRKTSERVKWGQRRSMENGIVFGNNSLYGYNLKDGCLAICSDEATVVRRIYQKFLNEGKGTHIIARELYEEGIAPPRAQNKPWSSTMILRILRNEKYCGDLLQKKFYTPNYLDHKKVINLNDDDKVYIRDHHEAIVSRDIFEQVQAELARRSPSDEQKARYSARYWCSGKIVCGCCGSRFVPRKRERGAGMSTYFCWVCHAKGHFGKRKIDVQGKVVGCNMRGLNNQIVCSCMTFILKQLQLDEARLIDEVLELLSCIKENNSSDEAENLRKQELNLMKKRDAVLDAYFDQIISKADLERLNERNEQELDRVRKRLSTLEKQVKVDARFRDDLEGLRSYMHGNIIGSEAVWSELLEKIIVNQDDVIIKLFAFPVAFRLCFKTFGRGDTYRIEITDCKMEPPVV